MERSVISYSTRLRNLVAEVSSRRSGFDHRPGHLGFLVVKVALGHVFIRVLFSLYLLHSTNAPHSSTTADAV
jgi:hypothetical protein